MTNQFKHGVLSGTVTGSSLADCSDTALRIAQRFFGSDAEITVTFYAGELMKKTPNADPSFRIPFTATIKGV